MLDTLGVRNEVTKIRSKIETSEPMQMCNYSVVYSTMYTTTLSLGWSIIDTFYLYRSTKYQRILIVMTCSHARLSCWFM
jgi:hypothetical protein